CAPCPAPAGTSAASSTPRQLAASLEPHRLPPGGADLRPALPLLGLRPLVEPALEMLELALQLHAALPAPRIEPAVLQCRLHRAVRLAVVRAVGEAAVGEQLRHVLEGLVQALA